MKAGPYPDPIVMLRFHQAQLSVVDNILAQFPNLLRPDTVFVHSPVRRFLCGDGHCQLFGQHRAVQAYRKGCIATLAFCVLI